MKHTLASGRSDRGLKDGSRERSADYDTGGVDARLPSHCRQHERTYRSRKTFGIYRDGIASAG